MTPEELKTRFTYHSPSKSQAGCYEALREHGREIAEAIDDLCPESREKSLAFTKIEEAIMWANAGIARRS